jgi:hypothetical protein
MKRKKNTIIDHCILARPGAFPWLGQIKYNRVAAIGGQRSKNSPDK